MTAEIFMTVDSDNQAIDMEVSSDGSVGMELDVALATLPVDEYDGPYEVTPSEGGQTLATSGKHMAQDVVVGRIPSNYGLITWDGRVITVS